MILFCEWSYVEAQPFPAKQAALTTSSDMGSKNLGKWYQPTRWRAQAVFRQERSEEVVCSYINSVSGVERFHQAVVSLTQGGVPRATSVKGLRENVAKTTLDSFSRDEAQLLISCFLHFVVCWVYLHTDVRIYLGFTWRLLDPHPQTFVFVFSVCQLDLKIKHPDCQFNYILLLTIFLEVSCL